MEVQRSRKESATKPLYGLLPFFLAAAQVGAYLYLQPVILNFHLIPFVFYAGMLNAYAVGRIIVAHLTKDSEFPMHNVLTFPLGVAVLDSLGPTVGLWPSALGFGTYQIAFVFMLMGLSFGVYGSFVVCFSSLPFLVLRRVIIFLFLFSFKTLLEMSFNNVIFLARRHHDHLRLPRYMVFNHQTSLQRDERRVEEGEIGASPHEDVLLDGRTVELLIL